jgi:glycosyltransferase involved in cell wall biosynthesis
MNILFLHSSSDLYGASKILLAINEQCFIKGHKAIVVLSDNGPLVEKLEASGVQVIISDLGILRRQYLHPRGVYNRLKSNYNAYQFLIQLCKAEQIDLIYSNTTGVVVGVFVAAKLNIKHLWHIHEIIEKPYFLFRFLSYLIQHKSNHNIVVSEAVKKHWATHVSPNKLEVLYNGVDYWLFNNPATSLRKELNISQEVILIGMMGRLHFWKGQDYFIKIAAELSKKQQNLHFLIVGDAFAGYEYLSVTINNLIDANHLKGHVTQLPYRSDILNIYNALDVFILPSLLPDPAPTVVTEAMAAGIPVVATNQGGAVEMIEHHKSGLFIPVNNAIQAAEIIDPLITDEVARKNMGAAAKKRMQEAFSRIHFNKQIIAIIEQQ